MQFQFFWIPFNYILHRHSLVNVFPHSRVAIIRPFDESFPSDDVMLTGMAYMYMAS